MPVGFNSPARNLFLLGSSGAQVVTNFFKTIDQSAGTDGSYEPDEIKYNEVDQKFILAGSALDSNTQRFGWFEKRDSDGISDFENRVVSTQVGVDTFLRAMELDSNNNLIVVGANGDIPWIAKYSNAGVLDWQSTTNSADVGYFDVASDSNGQYYACGNTPTNNNDSVAFVEKFDASGNPGWGKSAIMLGGDIRLEAIECNSRGEVVAGGRIQDETRTKAYLVKIDTNTGEVLWDRTIISLREDSAGNPEDTFVKDVYIDSNDQIYVVGRITTIGTTNRSFIIKYSPEGNIIWQKETEQDIEYYQVKSDGETEQTVVFGVYQNTVGGSEGGVLSKYSKDGSLVWRRTLFSSFNNSDTFGERGKVNLDADPSFYYLLYIDGPYSALNGTPEAYTYGKVSSSGNGLGNFQYDEGTGETIDYEILSIGDTIGRLSDGSVRQDTSDLITYPFNANKLLFDDYATQVSNKKRQMDSADSFEYSGSPAIRPADFQELNLLGDVYSGSGNWLDQSGKGNSGTINGATYNAAGYFDFDGVDDEITIDNITHGTSAITYECWVRTANGYSPSEYKSLMSTYDPNPGFWILLNPTNAYVAAGNDGGTFHVSSTTVADGNWHHVVATYDNPNIRIYVDGVDVGGLSNAPNNNIPTRTFRIGSQSISGTVTRFLDGDIGEVRVYPRALTPAQVFQNYNATKTKYTNEAPETAPKIGPGIVYGSNLLLNYDFGNRATYNTYRYPSSSSFWQASEIKLLASDREAGDFFGESISVGDGKIVISATNGDEGASNSGCVYVYNLDGSNEFKITPPSPISGGAFGLSVAVGSGKIAVSSFYSVGRFDIFDIDGTNPISKFTGFTGGGVSVRKVAIGNNKLLTGVPGYESNRGGVGLYNLDGTNEKLWQGSDVWNYGTSPQFGSSIAMGDGIIVVGCPYREGGVGAIYIYPEDGPDVDEFLTAIPNSKETIITFSDRSEFVNVFEQFGSRVAVGSGKIVVGCPNKRIPGNSSSLYGAVYVYDLDGSNEVKITPSDAYAGQQFGNSVAVDGGKIVVGTTNDNGFRGAIYVYDLDGSNEVKLAASDGGASDYLSTGLDISDGTIVAGGQYIDDGALNSTGGAYIYSLNTPLPTTVKNLSSSSFPGTINGATFNSAGYFEFNPSTTQQRISFSGAGLAVGTGDYSIEAWVHHTDVTGQQTYFTDAFGDTAGPYFAKKSNTDGGVVGLYYGGGWTLEGTTILSVNTWYHVVVSRASGTTTLYVNATSEDSGSDTVSITNSDMDIGDSDTSSGQMKGYIAETRFYTRALTATEVSQNFNATRGKYGV